MGKKKSAEVKARVEPPAKEFITRKAVAHGMTEADYLRQLIHEAMDRERQS
jgi:predicted DNA binding CopG/RHH family protein